jgi:hypothetical protein
MSLPRRGIFGVRRHAPRFRVMRDCFHTPSISLRCRSMSGVRARMETGDTRFAHLQKGDSMYEKSRHIATFFIAGFQYYDGADVLSKLSAGDRLTIEEQPDNPHDPDAIALRY